MATSALNRNAPIFVPMSYRAVEDFSDQWWDLVQSSPWFRDYWLHECFSDPQNGPPFSVPAGATQNDVKSADDGVSKGGTDLVALGWLKWRRLRGGAEAPRYCDKAPKIVSARVSPRPIQQPR